MRYIMAMVLAVVAGGVQAAAMTDIQFKQQAKLYLDDLELKQAALNLVVTQMQHPSIMVARACDYSKGLKAFKQFSKENLHLKQAKDDYQFISQLDRQFDQSLMDLGTTYETGCVLGTQLK